MYLFVQLLHIETGWVIKGVNSESGKIQTPESRSSKFKLNHARNFFKGVHQCQTDIVQEAGLFAPSLASFDETIETFWKCQLPCLSPVPVLCAINVFKRQFLLWFCKIRRLVLVFLPGSWMCLCWDWGHWRCAAQRCTAHASVVYFEPWLPSTAGWLYCCGGACPAARVCLKLWPSMDLLLSSVCQIVGQGFRSSGVLLWIKHRVRDWVGTLSIMQWTLQ